MEASIPDVLIRNSTNDCKSRYERSEKRSPSELLRKINLQGKTKNKRSAVPIRNLEKRRNAETSVMGTKR